MNRAPEFDSTPLARPYLVLLPYREDGRYSKDEIATAPRVMASDDPAGLPAQNPGTMVAGTNGVLYIANSAGALVAQQGVDAELAAIAGLTSAADKLPYFSGSGAAALADFGAAARTLLAATTAALQRAAMGLGAALCRPVISIGTETGNKILVSIQLTDIDGNNVARAQAFHVVWQCSDPDTKFTGVVTDMGSLPSGAGATVTGISNASGLLVLELEDTSPEFIGTGSILVTPVSNGTDALVGFPSQTTATFA